MTDKTKIVSHFSIFVSLFLRTIDYLCRINIQLKYN